MKGKIIVIDNKIEATKNMVVKNKYILAHTSQVALRPNRYGAARFRNRNQLNPNDDQNNGNENAFADFENNMLNPDYGHTGGAKMSMVHSARDENIVKEAYKKRLFNLVQND